MKRPESGRIEVSDGGCPGLTLRLTADGKRTWFLLYRVKGNTTLRRMVLGAVEAYSLEEARAWAMTKKAIASTGVDPNGEVREDRLLLAQGELPPPSRVTVEQLAKRFLEEHCKPNRKRWMDDERTLRVNVYPALGDRPIAELAKREIVALQQAIAKTAPVMSNRTFGVLRTMCRWGLKMEYIDRDPTAGLEPLGKEASRERFLTHDEIRQLWHALDGKGESGKPIATTGLRDLVRLLLLTGQRSGEAKQLRWSDIDWKEKTWTIPAEVSKNGRLHVVPLTDPAIAILKDRKADAKSQEWVFTSRTAKDGAEPMRSALKSFLRVLDRAGIAHATIHDLRRTVSSGMGEIGVDQFIIARVLNHTTDRSVTDIYNRHTYLAQKRQALEKWADRLTEITSATCESETESR